MLYNTSIINNLGVIMICKNILEAVGNTPIIELQRVAPEGAARILVKYEGTNIGGSIKTRTALKMIEEAEKRGDINPDTVIVEPTSGNQGIGLALVGAVKGYKVIIIMPDSVSEERRLLISQYGAELRLVHDAGDIGEAINECIRQAEEMAANDPNVYMPNQFANADNIKAHTEGTALEIIEQVDGPIDGYCSGIGTGGTISGIGKILKANNPDIKIVACEPENAAILSGGSIGTHIQMGIGDGLIPDILDTEIYNDIYMISDEEALQVAKDMASKEGILCGISSGTNVCAAIRLAKELGPGKTVVTILPDTGERYFSVPLFDRD